MKKKEQENKAKRSIFGKKKPNQEPGVRDPKKKLLTAYGWKAAIEALAE